ncbi:MAG: 4a-hydroxytetrahydrobiopterin dehydratase [Deltaproteobacteria bacterium]|nr:4a-hydroxytetrahydrobiopterin dehydratase [Deltaproteobacteria bacterium]
MTELCDLSCVPCKGGVPALTPEQTAPLLEKLSGWEIEDNHHLIKNFKFPNFVTALEFVNKVGEIAEQQGHHPDIAFTWGKVQIKIFTHKIDGLVESDFVLAAKIDKVK